MTSNKIRPAKKKDFDYFFKNERVVYSAKAWVLCAGKDRVAIGGVWIMPRQFTAFVKVKNNLPKKTFFKSVKIGIKKINDSGYPIVCFRDEKTKNSKKFLEKLGFQYFKTFNNQEVYKLSI